MITINIHKCETCQQQVLYSMIDEKWRHAKKTDCKGGRVAIKNKITK